jgi:hypothetical protein
MKSTLMALTLALAVSTSAQEATPQHSTHNHKDHSAQEHDQHQHDAMNQRGDQAMGFDQNKTTHHFLLAKDGGSIAVSANSAEDTTSANQIRQHLEHISHAFAAGDFDIPMFVHDQVPPGVPVMKRLKGKIQYSYEKSDKGARVVIRSGDAEAVNAIHEFLRFQINEHKTGDPLSIQ